MRRIIVHDEINTAYGTEQMSFRMTSFEEILNYFKLINGWLNSQVCAKRKSMIAF